MATIQLLCYIDIDKEWLTCSFMHFCICICICSQYPTNLLYGCCKQSRWVLRQADFFYISRTKISRTSRGARLDIYLSLAVLELAKYLVTGGIVHSQWLVIHFYESKYLIDPLIYAYKDTGFLLCNKRARVKNRTLPAYL